MRTHKKEGKYIALAIGFCGFIGLLLILLGIDFVYREVSRSRYDGNVQWVVAEPNNTYVVIEPESRRLRRVTSPTSRWPADITSTVTLPISSPSQIGWVLSQHASPSLSTFDAVRLWLWGQSGVKVAPETTSDVTDVRQSPFWDERMAAENKAIQVINASTVTGIGNTLATQLGAYGARVIAVETGVSASDTTRLLVSGDSYTARRLGSLLRVTREVDPQQGIADIVIIVGKKGWGQ